MEPILSVAAMEYRRVAGRFLVPVVAMTVLGIGWCLFFEAVRPHFTR